jgi:small GTP-binding protein
MDTIKKKICLLGDPAVGKTSLIRRFVIDKYDDKYISTLGTKVSKKVLTDEEMEKSLTLMIWDLTGQPEFNQVHEAAFRKAAGALVVGDITRKETIDNMEFWIAAAQESEGSIPIIMLANKSDLIEQAEVDKAYLEAFASRLNADYMLTSAKTGNNVEIAFHHLGKMIMGLLETPVLKLDTTIVARIKEKPKGKEILHIEDRIVAKFCEIIGNEDFGMSILRKQFQKKGIDFNKPTYEGLRSISDELVEIVRVFKGDQMASKTRMEMARIINGGAPGGAVKK